VRPYEPSASLFFAQRPILPPITRHYSSSGRRRAPQTTVTVDFESNTLAIWGIPDQSDFTDDRLRDRDDERQNHHERQNHQHPERLSWTSLKPLLKRALATSSRSAGSAASSKRAISVS
jgi:hypothetical protein